MAEHHSSSCEHSASVTAAGGAGASSAASLSQVRNQTAKGSNLFSTQRGDLWGHNLHQKWIE